MNLKQLLIKLLVKILTPVIKQVLQEMADKSIIYRVHENRVSKIEILENWFFETNLRERYERLKTNENDTTI